MGVDRFTHRGVMWSAWVYSLAGGVFLGTMAWSEAALSAEAGGEAPRPGPPSARVSVLDKHVSGAGASAGIPGVQGPAGGGNVSLFFIEVGIDTKAVDMEAIKAGRSPPLALSAYIPGAPLRKVLLELGRKLEAKVYMAEGMGEQPIAVKFKNLPVEKGIKQILQSKSYVVTRAKAPVQQGMKDTGEMRIVDIRVLGLAVSGQNAAAAPAAEIKELRADPAEQKNEVAELTRLLREAEKPQDRMKALKLLLDKTEASAHVELVMQALKDPDPTVRMYALGRMSDLTEAPPMEPVAEIALKGESTRLRIVALGALLSTRGAEATPVLEQILSDDGSNPAMRKAAEAGLHRIERVQAIVKEMERRRAALATEAAKQ